MGLAFKAQWSAVSPFSLRALMKERPGLSTNTLYVAADSNRRPNKKVYHEPHSLKEKKNIEITFTCGSKGEQVKRGFEKAARDGSVEHGTPLCDRVSKRLSGTLCIASAGEGPLSPSLIP